RARLPAFLDVALAILLDGLLSGQSLMQLEDLSLAGGQLEFHAVVRPQVLQQTGAAAGNPTPSSANRWSRCDQGTPLRGWFRLVAPGPSSSAWRTARDRSNRAPASAGQEQDRRFRIGEL